MSREHPIQTRRRGEDLVAAHQRRAALSAESNLQFSTLGLGIGIGTLAGLLGGLFMMVTMLVRAFILDADPLQPLQAVSALWFGPDALISEAPVVEAGIATHYAVAVGWGILFGIITSRLKLTPAASVGAALVYATFIWLLMTFVIFPWLNPTMDAFVETMPGVWFLSHMFYALPLMIVPLSLRNRAVEGERRAGLGHEGEPPDYSAREPATATR